MERLPWADVTCCKYGTPYRKQTRLWTNMRWRPRRSLWRPGSRCEAWQDGRHLRAAQRGPRLMEGQYERVSQSRELLYSVPAALCEEIARTATEVKNEEEGHPRLLAHSKAVSLNFKNEEEGHRASFLVFWAHSKAVSLNTKNGEERRRAFFLRFCSTSKAVSRCVKNEAEGHRASFVVF